MLLELLGCQGQQLRRSRQVPVRGGRIDVAEVRGQQGQPLRLATKATRIQQGVDREGVPLIPQSELAP